MTILIICIVAILIVYTITQSVKNNLEVHSDNEKIMNIVPDLTKKEKKLNWVHTKPGIYEANIGEMTYQIVWIKEGHYDYKLYIGSNIFWHCKSNKFLDFNKSKHACQMHYNLKFIRNK